MDVQLVSITKPVFHILKDMTSEEYIIYIARVSSPNQLVNETAPRLLKYCINHGHWSIFDQVDFTVEILTSRGIAPQILRHWSARFQEFSLRYAVASSYEDVELRMQGEKNRQGGEIICEDAELNQEVKDFVKGADEFYQKLIKRGVSKETARFILPLCTSTRLYMKNSVRNWLAYLNQRLHHTTQKEHRLIGERIKDIMIKEFPIISGCFDNFATAYDEKFM